MSHNRPISLLLTVVAVIVMILSQPGSMASNLPTGTWTVVSPSTSPVASGQFGFATNTKTQDIYLYGGNGAGSSYINQFLVYNTTLDNWLTVSDSNRPGALYDPSMTYDPINDQIILFGGKFTTSSWHSGISIFNFNNNTWTSIVRSTQPSDRTNQRMTYDSTHKVHLMYGGYLSTNTENQELWQFNVTDYKWTLLSATNLPGIRYLSHFVYIPTLDASLLFGGRTTTGFLGGTYLYFYGNNTWKQLNTVNNPSVRSNGAIAYNPDTDRVILSSGLTTGDIFLGDTWQFNPNTLDWTEVSTNQFDTRAGHRLTYSSDLNSYISFGGILSSGQFLSTTSQLQITDNIQETVTNTKTDTTTETVTETTVQTNLTNITNIINSTNSVSLSTSFFLTILPVTMLSVVALYRSKRQ